MSDKSISESAPDAVTEAVALLRRLVIPNVPYVQEPEIRDLITRLQSLAPTGGHWHDRLPVCPKCNKRPGPTCGPDGEPNGLWCSCEPQTGEYTPDGWIGHVFDMCSAQPAADAEDLFMWREGICPADVGTSRPGYDGPEVTCETCPSTDGCKFKRIYSHPRASGQVG